MRKICKILALTFAASVALAGCTQKTQRSIKTEVSNWTGGLDRTVTVYDYNGKAIKSWSGKFDVQAHENSILFDKDGKRVIIYSGIIVNEEN